MSNPATGYHTQNDSSLMRSTESLVIIDDSKEPDEMVSMNIHNERSFQLVDGSELKMNSEEFAQRLDHNSNVKFKVVSVLGNSGDGKSYCLNKLLFKNEVFRTSKSAENGTRGVWFACEGAKKLLCIDTPPLHSSQETDILLMKIVAISDVVIYITRSERLPEDLFAFLGQVSKALKDSFKDVLSKLNPRTEGPTIFICHQPLHSDPLTTGKNGESPEDQIKEKFKALGYNTDHVGKIFYISRISSGGCSYEDNSSLFDVLGKRLMSHLEDIAFRQASRSPESIFETLKELLTRFRGRLTCDVVCEACDAVCCLSMGHKQENIDHKSEHKCRYQSKYENKILMCRKCNEKVKLVKHPNSTWLSYAQSALHGYELHCRGCGMIYKSRQYWFGNQSPEDTVVYPKFVHVWSGSNSVSNKDNLSVRKALEGVGNLMNSAYIYSTDYIAPAYWQPNSEITNCAVCSIKLEINWGEVHHCRNCGKGVCNSCSGSRQPVPHRGWNEPVRVCNKCAETPYYATGGVEDIGNHTPRKVSEAVVNVLKPLSSALNYPKGIITELARPSYWIPDEETPHCAVCDLLFGQESNNARHHCRQCGYSVCRSCSPYRMSVPERGWDKPVRVCKKCVVKQNGDRENI